MEALVKVWRDFFDFTSVLNTSISASWLILAVVLCRVLFKKAPKWLHVAMWGMVAFRLLLPFSLESPFSLIPSAQTIPEKIMRYEGEALAEPAYIEIVSNPIISEPLVLELDQSVDRVQINDMYMTLIWWGGMLVMLSYTLWTYIRLRYKVRTAVRLQENIYQSEYIETAFVMGLFRPCIYIPYKMSEKDRLYVVAHEQAHIKRYDNWWKPLGFFLLMIHWFNPLMWLAYGLFCKDVEMACDEKVARKLDKEQRADYSQALLTCSVKRKGIAACPLAFGEVGVFDRVKNVLNYHKPAFLLVLATILACVVLVLCFLTDPVKAREAEKLPDEETSLATDGFVSLGHEYYTDNYSDFYWVNYQVNLGNDVKSGHIYVERWQDGLCEEGIPFVISETTNELNIRMTTHRDAALGSVSIWTDDLNGEWVVDYGVPEEDYLLGWSFMTNGNGKNMDIQQNDERILAVVAYDGGKLGDSVMEEPGKLKEDVGYAVVVRAVFGEGITDEDVHGMEVGDAPDKIQEEPYTQAELDLSQVVNLDNVEQTRAYIEALENIVYDCTFPDGYVTTRGNSTRFALYDIDVDGSVELLLVHDGSMADTFLRIYDYDEKLKNLYCELEVFPSVSFYKNGMVEAFASHNHGMAPGYVDEDFWPYSLYEYNKETDTYEYLLNVDGWEKEHSETSWTGEAFQEKADLDGDGVLYYIMTDGEYNYDEPTDGAAYEKWRNSILGERVELKLQYIHLPYMLPEAAA